MITAWVAASHRQIDVLLSVIFLHFCYFLLKGISKKLLANKPTTNKQINLPQSWSLFLATPCRSSNLTPVKHTYKISGRGVCNLWWSSQTSVVKRHFKFYLFFIELLPVMTGSSQIICVEFCAKTPVISEGPLTGLSRINIFKAITVRWIICRILYITSLVRRYFRYSKTYCWCTSGSWDVLYFQRCSVLSEYLPVQSVPRLIT